MVNVVTSSDGGDRTPDLTIMSRALSPSELHRPRFFRPAPKRPRTKEWSPLTESNCRPFPYHGNALPTELRGRGDKVSACDLVDPRALPAKPKERLTRPRGHTQIRRPPPKNTAFSPPPRPLFDQGAPAHGARPAIGGPPQRRGQAHVDGRSSATVSVVKHARQLRPWMQKTPAPGSFQCDPGADEEWCQMMDSNQRRQSRRIYNPLPLAARAIWRTPRGCEWNATPDDPEPAKSAGHRRFRARPKPAPDERRISRRARRCTTPPGAARPWPECRANRR